MTENKVHAIDGETIFELEDKINEFNATHNVFATQIFPKKKGYDAMIFYKPNGIEPIMDPKKKAPSKPNKAQPAPEQEGSEEMATSGQIYTLTNKLEMSEEEAKAKTKKEAWAIISEAKKNGRL